MKKNRTMIDDVFAEFIQNFYGEKIIDCQSENISKLFSNISSNFIIEIKLGSTAPIFDFSLCILKSEIIYLLKHWEKQKLVPLFNGNKNWEKIYKFCSKWEERGSIINEKISDIWFEFDNYQMNLKLPGACFFFSSRNIHKRNIADWKIIDTDWLLESALAILINEYLSEGIKKKVKKCIDALPKNGALFQVGVMLARGFNNSNDRNFIRLCTCMKIDDYMIYLNSIGWNGPIEYLINNLNIIKKYTDAVFIDIDVGEKISPHIGLECCYRQDINMNERLNKFLNHLINKGLCLKEKSAIITKWIESPTVITDNIENERIFKKSLSHLKIVLNPDKTLNAKAYLSLSNTFTQAIF
jgi:hypothetical protein